MAMTAEERGAYIHLLACMWNTEDCSLNANEDYLSKISGVDKVVITSLYHCFKVVNGRLRHKRLDYERDKQDSYREKCSQAGKRGMEKRWSKSQSNKVSNKVVITKDNSSSSSSSSSPPSSSTIKKVSSKEDKATPRKENKEITEMLMALKGTIGIDAFADSRIERNIGIHIVNLYQKIGREEFRRRLDYVLDDDFRRKNCNRIKYLYGELKSVPIVNNKKPNII